MEHHCKGRWIDDRGRSHDWELKSDLADRRHIEQLVRSRYPATKVIINFVGSDAAEAERRRKQHIAKENERREQHSNHERSSSSDSSKTQIKPSNYSYQSGSEGSGIDLGSAAWIAALIATIWVFVTYTPWVLMALCGSAAAWLSTKATGTNLSDVDDGDLNDPRARRNIAILACSALILGGIGFGIGSNLQKQWSEGDPSAPKIKSQDTKQEIQLQANTTTIQSPEKQVKSADTTNRPDQKEHTDPCTIWRESNPTLAQNLKPGDSCY